MNFKLSITINGVDVLKAETTGVMAKDIIDGFFTGNLAGTRFKVWWHTHRPTLGEIVDLEPGKSITLSYMDETVPGPVRAVVRRNGAKS